MPWKASSVMEERLRFVARLLDGEAMTDVCRDFGISRKTGYKIFDRYKEHGLEALSDRSRRPVRYANQLPQQLEGLIVRLKAEKPLGRPQAPRAPGPAAGRRRQGSGQEHDPCGSRPSRPSQTWRRAAPPCARHAAVRGRCVQRSVVRRLQGRVQAWQRTLLLPADRHRPCLALPAHVRSLGINARRPCRHGL